MKHAQSFLRKKNTSQMVVEGEDVLSEVRSWYSERYATTLLQRNILLLLVFLCMLAMFVAMFIVREVTASKTIRPFVIEVDERTGITNIVNPATSAGLASNEALNRYFLVQYVQARETYASYTYQYQYYTVVRLLSDRDVYNEFRGMLGGPQSPITKYASGRSSTELKIRSIQFLSDKTAQVRYSLLEKPQGNAPIHRIATINFEYIPMELSWDERYINPLGFQVTGFRANEENI